MNEVDVDFNYIFAEDMEVYKQNLVIVLVKVVIILVR